MSVKPLIFAFFISEFLAVKTGTWAVAVGSRPIVYAYEGFPLEEFSAIGLDVQLPEMVEELSINGELVLETVVFRLGSITNLDKLTLNASEDIQVITCRFNSDHKMGEGLSGGVLGEAIRVLNVKG